MQAREGMSFGRRNQSSSGKHGVQRKVTQGRCTGSRMADIGDMSQIAFAATLRAAAPWQNSRLKAEAEKEAGKPGEHIVIRREDYRVKKISAGNQAGILFVVDASRSQGAQKRLAFAKGAVLSLIAQAYTTRDKTGLITFGNSTCEVLLPLTRSVEYAARRLEQIPAAGNTPLAMGLRKAMEVFEAERKRFGDFKPFLILLTDGKANFDTEPGVPFELALAAASQIYRAGIPSLVIDTEHGFFSLGLAEKIAEALHGEYVTL